jgi:hypothetical protein
VQRCNKTFPLALKKALDYLGIFDLNYHAFILMTTIKYYFEFLNNTFYDINYIDIINHIKNNINTNISIDIEHVFLNEEVKLYKINVDHLQFMLFLDNNSILFLGSLNECEKDFFNNEIYYVFDNNKEDNYKIIICPSHVYFSRIYSTKITVIKVFTL